MKEKDICSVTFSDCEVKIEKMFDIHDNANVYVNTQQEKESKDNSLDTSSLPTSLATPKAMELWNKAQKSNLVDEHFQPRKLSQTKIAILAYVMGDILKLNPCWAPFKELWHFDNITSKHDQAINSNFYSEYVNELREIFK